MIGLKKGLGIGVAVVFWAAFSSPGRGAEVTAQVVVTPAKGALQLNPDSRVVFWLTPLEPQPVPPALPTASTHPSLVQKNKVFEPHVLAVQVGSQVDFPNHDPFFHNVFSLFNGKRFDLGLYEAGKTRRVRFDRAGVCYIFCNIHPQMSAVVVVVDTPYFAISKVRGELTIPAVPPGSYRLNVWEEHCVPEALVKLSREITVDENGASLGTVQLQESKETAMAHLNKYGKQYDSEVFSSPFYQQP